MQELFNKTRALIPWLKEQQSSEPGPTFINEQLRQALFALERRNRGHSNRLSDPALSVGRVRRYTSTGTYDETRAATLRETSRDLLSALASMTRADMPAAALFDRLINATDGSGWLRANTLEALRWGDYKASLPAGFELVSTTITQDGFITAHVCVRLYRSLGLSASRSVGLSLKLGTAGGTLLDHWTVLRDAKRSIKELLAGVEAWPEFAADKRDLALRNAIQSKLGLAFAGFTPEESQWTVDHWSELVPKTLRSAQRLKHAA